MGLLTNTSIGHVATNSSATTTNSSLGTAAATGATAVGAVPKTATAHFGPTHKRNTETAYMAHGIQLGDNKLPEAPETSINLNLGLDKIKPIVNQGFSVYRPELLATFGFEAAYENTTDPNVIAKALDTQIQARQLKSENIVRLLNELDTNNTTAEILSTIRERLGQQENEAGADVKLLHDLTVKMSKMRRAFNVKAVGDIIKSEVSLTRATAERLSSRDLPARSITDLLIDDLGFSSQNLQHFTNTKILAQLLDDLRVIATSFSPKTLSSINFKRQDDFDAIRINRLDVLLGSAVDRFSILDLKSCCSDVANAALKREFEKFQSSLSSVNSIDERIKLMVTIISKELRVSTGLSIDAIKKTLRDAFDVESNSNVFLKMIGNFGDDVIQPIASTQHAIANFLRLDSGRQAVLPFETVHVGDKFIPGQEILIDPILGADSQFDTSVLSEYVNSFHNAIESMLYVFEGTLDVDILNSNAGGLGGVDVYRRLMSILIEQIDLAMPQRNSTPIDKVTLATLVYARNDPELKYLLYLNILEKALDRRQRDLTSTTASQKHLFFDALDSAGLTLDVVRAHISDITYAVFGRSSTGGLVDLITERLRGSVAPVNINNIPASTASNSFGTFNSGPSTLGGDPVRNLGPNEIRIQLDAAAASIVDAPIFHKLVAILEDLDDRARKSIFATAPDSNPNSYMSDTEPATTKFNQVGLHFFVLALLEALINIVVKLDFVSVSGINHRQPEYLSELVVNIDPDAISVARVIVDSLDEEFDLSLAMLQLTSAAQQKRSILSPQFQQIATSFVSEDNLIKNMLDALNGFKNNLDKSFNDVQTFFTRNSSRLSELAVEDADRFISFDSSQVVLAQNYLNEYINARHASIEDIRSNTDISLSDTSTPFVDDNMVLPSVRNEMFRMLRDPRLISDRSSNAQIMSVGLPAGFTAALRNRTTSYLVGQDFSEFQQQAALRGDIIKLNVFMQDLLLEDIVFKPVSFIFQLGRFTNNQAFNVVSRNATFEQALSEYATNVVQSSGEIRIERGIDVINRDVGYAFLRDTQKSELIRNHVTSYLLGVYINLLSGLSMSEDTFLLNDELNAKKLDETTRKLFKEMLVRHVSQFVNRQVSFDELKRTNPDVKILLDRLDDIDHNVDVSGEIKDIFQRAPDSANVEIANDIVTFIDTFGKSSIIFGAAIRHARLISPKTFERIFSFVIDPDDFEIDVEQTNSTAAGHALLNSKIVSSTLLRPPATQTSSGNTGGLLHRDSQHIDSAVRRDLGFMTLRQYFMTVEQLPSFRQLETQERPVAPQTPHKNPAGFDVFNVPKDATLVADTAVGLGESLHRTIADAGRARGSGNGVAGGGILG